MLDMYDNAESLDHWGTETVCVPLPELPSVGFSAHYSVPIFICQFKERNLVNFLHSSPWLICSLLSESRLWILSSVMKCEKWIDQHDTSVEQRKKKKSESPTGMEPITSRSHGAMCSGGCRVGDSDLIFFSLSHASVLLINSPFTICSF